MKFRSARLLDTMFESNPAGSRRGPIKPLGKRRIVEPTKRSRNNIQLIWGAALILVGISVFFKVPLVVPKLEAMGLSGATIGFFSACLYIIGFILVGGGVRKWFLHFRPEEKSSEADPSENDDD
jgi:hypothetical protein